jgi:hypothetical protein
MTSSQSGNSRVAFYKESKRYRYDTLTQCTYMARPMSRYGKDHDGWMDGWANKPPPWHNEIIPSSYIDLQHYPMPPQDGAIGFHAAIPLLSPTINRHKLVPRH